MEIWVNGEPRPAVEGQTILDLLNDLGLAPERVAVEMNRHIVKQAVWPDTVVPAGAKLEIVQFVGGG